MKHKHADLIHAWADGAEIQTKYGDRWIPETNPYWDEAVEYRIKPEEKKPVVRWLWVYEDDCCLVEMMLSEEEAKGMALHKLEWSRTEFPE